MRSVDPEPIRAALDEVRGHARRRARARHRRVEQWRDRLIGDDRRAHRVRARACARRPAGAADADPQRAQGNRGETRAARAARALQCAARDLSMNPALVIGLVSISDRASARHVPGRGNSGAQGVARQSDHVARLARRDAPDSGRAAGDRSDAAASWSTRVGCHLVADHRRHGPGAARRDARGDARGRGPGHARLRRADAAGSALRFVPTAILSRQVGGGAQGSPDREPAGPAEIDPRNAAGPGPPDVPGIFAAVPYCIDLIGGPYIETRRIGREGFPPEVCDPASRLRRGSLRPTSPGRPASPDFSFFARSPAASRPCRRPCLTAAPGSNQDSRPPPRGHR